MRSGLVLVLVALACACAAADSAVTITVKPGARQTFHGFGTSQVPCQPDGYGDLTPPERAVLAKLVWQDARFRTLRTWWNPSTFAPSPGKEDISQYTEDYVSCGIIADARKAGATTVLLAPDSIPSYMGDGHGYIRDDQVAQYAELIARFIFDIKEQDGVRIDATGILNEPNDRSIRFNDSQWPGMIEDLRASLNTLGLGYVKIVTPELANCDDVAVRIVGAIKNDRMAWSELDAVATHTYGMGANDAFACLIAGSDKPYWITEAGGVLGTGAESPGDAMEGASAACRFLSDVNHLASRWIWFIGYEIPDPHDDFERLIRFTAHPWHYDIFEPYYYLKQLSQAFDNGAIFRSCESSLDQDMCWTFGHKPRVIAAAGRNPDGDWAIGVCNFTSDYFVSPQATRQDREQGGYRGQTYRVTIHIPELASSGKVIFQAYRSNSNSNIVKQAPVVMTDGYATLDNVAPFDLWTLREVHSAR